MLLLPNPQQVITRFKAELLFFKLSLARSLTVWTASEAVTLQTLSQQQLNTRIDNFQFIQNINLCQDFLLCSI